VSFPFSLPMILFMLSPRDSSSSEGPVSYLFFLPMEGQPSGLESLKLGEFFFFLYRPLFFPLVKIPVTLFFACPHLL